MEMPEAKIVLTEKYEQRIADLKKVEASIARKINIASVNGRIEKIELRADENEQYNRISFVYL